ncbi:MAG: glutathione S-transferase [Cellvibrionaceae bacterium]
MKLYDCHPAPNPRRVRIFIAEKGISIPTVQVDFAGKEHLTEAYGKINPFHDVPVLELDDGTYISQVNGICRYLESAFPENNLYGTDAKEQGVIAMWDNYVASQGFSSVTDGLRNFSKGFINHAVLGTKDYPQIPELAERGKNRTLDFMKDLDKYLATREYVACDRYSAADITALTTVDFAKRIKIEMSDDLKNLKRWYDLVSNRPSASV